MASGGARQDRRSVAHSGSAESRREVGFSVKLGRIVTAHLPSGREICGYVYGGDDYHWKIVGPDLDTHLVHKSASLSFGPQSYAGEPMRAELERLVGPYRDHLMRYQFGSTTKDPASDTSTTSTAP